MQNLSRSLTISRSNFCSYDMTTVAYQSPEENVKKFYDALFRVECHTYDICLTARCTGSNELADRGFPFVIA